jgi:protease-4
MSQETAGVQMKKNPLLVAFILLAVVSLLALIGIGAAVYTSMFGEPHVNVSSNSVLVMEVKGVIISPKEFVKSIERFREDKDLKAIVVRLDSPGGVVGPTQEMYDEIIRVRKENKIPVVASLGSVAASGAFYIAAACDKIVTNPGTITGSIGVIMEFANLSGLYSWAKVDRYVLKSGKYKDIGSEARSMTSEERNIMQRMLDSVHLQFKKAVAAGRKLSVEELEKRGLVDGRVVSGEQAVKLGLADKLGGLEEAVKLAAEMAHIKGKPDVFYPPQPRHHVWDMLMGSSSDEEESQTKLLRKVFGMEYSGQPLFLWPGALNRL